MWKRKYCLGVNVLPSKCWEQSTCSCTMLLISKRLSFDWNIDRFPIGCSLRVKHRYIIQIQKKGSTHWSSRWPWPKGSQEDLSESPWQQGWGFLVGKGSSWWARRRERESWRALRESLQRTLWSEEQAAQFPSLDIPHWICLRNLWNHSHKLLFQFPLGSDCCQLRSSQWKVFKEEVRPVLREDPANSILLTFSSLMRHSGDQGWTNIEAFSSIFPTNQSIGNVFFLNYKLKL